MKEKTARGMITALSNMYEKPSAGNRVFLMRELFTMRMRESGSVTDHINEINSILSRLSSVGMKLDDDTQAVILLSSLPESWSGFVTTVTETTGPETSSLIGSAIVFWVKTFAGETLVEDHLLVYSVSAGEETITGTVGVVEGVRLELGRM